MAEGLTNVLRLYKLSSLTMSSFYLLVRINLATHFSMSVYLFIHLSIFLSVTNKKISVGCHNFTCHLSVYLSVSVSLIGSPTTGNLT